MSVSNGKGTAVHQLPWLTVLRAVAALWVVVFHYGKPEKDAIFYFPMQPLAFVLENGHLAVDFFFVLSGFILTWNYSAHVRLNNKPFWIRRAVRIVPATIIALFVSYWLSYNSALPQMWANDVYQQKVLVANLLFLQSFFGMLEPNGPSWSLSVELYFYLGFPYVLWLLRRYRVAFLLLMTCWLIATWIYAGMNDIAILRGTDNVSEKLFDTHPITNGVKFLLGMYAAWLCMNYNQIKRCSVHPLISIALMFIVLYFLQPLQHVAYRPLYSLIFAYIIMCFATQNNTALPGFAKPFLFLGEISFGIYIYQLPVMQFVKIINGKWLHLGLAQEFYLFLPVLISIAVSSYYMFELPLMRFIAAKSARA